MIVDFPQVESSTILVKAVICTFYCDPVTHVSVNMTIQKYYKYLIST